MRRILQVLTAAVVMVVMLFTIAGTAVADPEHSGHSAFDPQTGESSFAVGASNCPGEPVGGSSCPGGPGGSGGRVTNSPTEGSTFTGGFGQKGGGGGGRCEGISCAGSL